jgi:hypothetical protein
MRVVRGWRWPALAALVVIVAGVIIALLQPSATSGYLDPGDASPTGGRALAALLTARGQQVARTQLPPRLSEDGGLELVTTPDLLSGTQLTQAGRFNGDILLVDPDAAALHAIAPRVSLSQASDGNAGVGQASGGDGSVASPSCAKEAAELAGTADIEGTLLGTDDPAAQRCYPGFTSTGTVGYAMITYADGSRTITILGSGAVLTNQYLADNGDAALAMNLMRDNRIVWVVPSIAGLVAAPGTGSSQQSFFDLVPWPAYLIAIQLGIAVMLAAAWRARRLGPLVAERLPVIVRASETVEGHGRLYQSRRARGRAAEVLRAATASRLARLTVGPPGTASTASPASTASSTSAIVHPDIIAARIGEQPTEVARLLYGPPPASDMDLVRLAADLDTLERKIRQS